MNDNKSLALLNSINDLFKIESSITLTNNSEVFKAIEVSSGRSVILVMLRRRFNVNQEINDMLSFLERLEKIKSFGTSLTNIINFGVDRDGIGYSISKISSVNSVLSGNMNYGEASRRFEAMLQILVKMHNADIVFGDICNNSFSISREGTIGALAINGSFPSHGETFMTQDDYVLPNNQEGISKASDMYRFAMLCYKLFLNDTEAYPFDSNKNYIPISSIKMQIPHYIDVALKTCLSANPSDRFSDAETFWKFIKQEREKLASSSDDSTMSPSNDEFNKIKVLNEIALRAETENHGKNKIFVVAAIVISFMTLLIIFLTYKKSLNNSNEMILTNQNVNNENIMIEKENKLNRIYDSEDPLMYVAMVNMASKSNNPSERKLVESYILKRFKSYRFDELVIILREFFNGIVGHDVPDFYENLLSSLDKNYPIERRITLFKEISNRYRGLIVNFAIALSLDTNDSKNYRDIFISLLDNEFKKDISRRSYNALMISEYTSWNKYEKLLNARLQELSDEDLIWLLSIFVKRDDKHLENIISMVTKRNLLDNMQSSFLSIINEVHPPKEIKDILLRAATSQIKRHDIQVVANWMNINKAKILYTMLLVIKNDNSLKKEIFDVLSVLTLDSEILNKYVQYVKQNFWDNRGELATLLPYINEPKVFSNQEILEVLVDSTKKLDSLSKRKILTILVENADIKIKKIIFENFYNELGVGILINYLADDDKDIKKLAIKGLKESGVNDVIVSNLIIEKYENENDDEIRELYKSSFWFIKKMEL